MLAKKGLIAAGATIAAFAAAPSAQAACGLTDCQQVTGTVASAIAVTASSPVALGNGIPGTLSLGATAPDATGQGTVAVVSTNQYCLRVQDTANNGLLTNAGGAGSGQFTTPLKWSSATAGVVPAAGTPAALSNTIADIALNQPVTLLKTFTIDYSQVVAGQNVPAGAYSTTSQFSAQSC